MYVKMSNHSRFYCSKSMMEWLFMAVRICNILLNTDYTDNSGDKILP